MPGDACISHRRHLSQAASRKGRTGERQVNRLQVKRLHNAAKDVKGEIFRSLRAGTSGPTAAWRGRWSGAVTGLAQLFVVGSQVVTFLCTQVHVHNKRRAATMIIWVVGAPGIRCKPAERAGALGRH
jgi:hypothetical protein